MVTGAMVRMFENVDPKNSGRGNQEFSRGGIGGSMVGNPAPMAPNGS